MTRVFQKRFIVVTPGNLYSYRTPPDLNILTTSIVATPVIAPTSISTGTFPPTPGHVDSLSAQPPPLSTTEPTQQPATTLGSSMRSAYNSISRMTSPVLTYQQRDLSIPGERAKLTEASLKWDITSASVSQFKGKFTFCVHGPTVKEVVVFQAESKESAEDAMAGILNGCRNIPIDNHKGPWLSMQFLSQKEHDHDSVLVEVGHCMYYLGGNVGVKKIPLLVNRPGEILKFSLYKTADFAKPVFEGNLPIHKIVANKTHKFGIKMHACNPTDQPIITSSSSPSSNTNPSSGSSPSATNMTTIYMGITLHTSLFPYYFGSSFNFETPQRFSVSHFKFLLKRADMIIYWYIDFRGRLADTVEWRNPAHSLMWLLWWTFLFLYSGLFFLPFIGLWIVSSILVKGQKHRIHKFWVGVSNFLSDNDKTPGSTPVVDNPEEDESEEMVEEDAQEVEPESETTQAIKPEERSINSTTGEQPTDPGSSLLYFYENQRRVPGSAVFHSNNLLVIDRPKFSDEKGNLVEPGDLNLFQIYHPPTSVEFFHNLTIEEKIFFESTIFLEQKFDKHGWQYSWRWAANFTPECGSFSLVRRRLWIRVSHNDALMSHPNSPIAHSNQSLPLRPESPRVSTPGLPGKGARLTKFASNAWNGRSTFKQMLNGVFKKTEDSDSDSSSEVEESENTKSSSLSSLISDFRAVADKVQFELRDIVETVEGYMSLLSWKDRGVTGVAVAIVGLGVIGMWILCLWMAGKSHGSNRQFTDPVLKWCLWLYTVSTFLSGFKKGKWKVLVRSNIAKHIHSTAQALSKSYVSDEAECEGFLCWLSGGWLFGSALRSRQTNVSNFLWGKLNLHENEVNKFLSILGKKCFIDLTRAVIEEEKREEFLLIHIESLSERIRKKILLYPTKWLRRDWLDNLLTRAPLNHSNDYLNLSEEVIDWEHATIVSATDGPMNNRDREAAEASDTGPIDQEGE